MMAMSVSKLLLTKTRNQNENADAEEVVDHAELPTKIVIALRMTDQIVKARNAVLAHPEIALIVARPKALRVDGLLQPDLVPD